MWALKSCCNLGGHLRIRCFQPARELCKFFEWGTLERLSQSQKGKYFPKREFTQVVWFTNHSQCVSIQSNHPLDGAGIPEFTLFGGRNLPTVTKGKPIVAQRIVQGPHTPLGFRTTHAAKGDPMRRRDPGLPGPLSIESPESRSQPFYGFTTPGSSDRRDVAKEGGWTSGTCPLRYRIRTAQKGRTQSERSCPSQQLEW